MCVTSGWFEEGCERVIALRVRKLRMSFAEIDPGLQFVGPKGEPRVWHENHSPRTQKWWQAA